MSSILIKNGNIVDGTGNPATIGDIGIKDGKIVSADTLNGDADQVIDATGKVVAPGFIDIHTHYDPQLCWDRLATPSLEHGCTSVVIGNCSLSIAPIHNKDSAKKLVTMFRVIEDITEKTFDAGVPWKWQSFPEYLDYLRKDLGINVGALVGHSVLRLYVMGDAAQERAATDDEIAEMCRVLKDAMKAGAIGLSTSYVDVDENMKPVPSRFAELKEKIALAKAMAETGRGVMQTVPDFITEGQQIACIEELAEISKASGIMCTLAPIVHSPISNLWQDSLKKLEEVNAAGAKVYGQSMPRPFDINMRLNENSFLLLGTKAGRTLINLPRDKKLPWLQQEENQKKFVNDLDNAPNPIFTMMRVGRCAKEENKKYEGKYLAELAAQSNRSPAQIVLDIALSEGLETEFQLAGVIHSDENHVSKILDHPYCHIGASDAGAHIAQFCGAGDTTYILQRYVRERKDMTLERAIYRMTGEVADAWGIRDRGVLAEGKAADVIVFDLDKIARGPEEFVHDVPGDANRYIRKAEGMEQVIVNGQVVVKDGAYTDARAGAIV